jgi:hypothetical protein
MKTMIAAFALVLLAAGPTFAASPSTWQLREGHTGIYVPYSGGYSGSPGSTSREGLIHAF